MNTGRLCRTGNFAVHLSLFLREDLRFSELHWAEGKDLYSHCVYVKFCATVLSLGDDSKFLMPHVYPLS